MIHQDDDEASAPVLEGKVGQLVYQKAVEAIPGKTHYSAMRAY